MRKIEQVLARFLWGSCYTTNKTHWIKWERVCLPIEEGGLGLRRISDIVEAFSIKMWWRFLEQGSLWALYMFHKYCSASLYPVLSKSKRFSPMRRRMFKAGQRCRGHIRWMLGEGKICFWYDTWLADVPLVNVLGDQAAVQPRKVSDFWQGEQWDKEEVWSLNEELGVPVEVIEQILQTPFDRGEKDRGRWALSPNGNFSVAAVWEAIRNRAEKREVHKFFWNKCVRPTISFFLWRLMANRVPVEAKLQWRGVSLASICKCCDKPGIETKLHLFVNGEGASRVWRYFAGWFPQVPILEEGGVNIDVRLRWLQRHLKPRLRNHVSYLVPSLIFWFLWTERNNCVHREKKFLVENVIRKVENYLRDLMLAKLIGPEQWEGCCFRESSVSGSAGRRRVKRVERIQWRPPDPGWLKINTDGAFHLASQSSGGGGILRDHNEDIVEAFAANAGAASGLEAEMRAILMGLLLAKQHGDHIWLETDAAVIAGWINSSQLGADYVRHIMVNIRRELRDLVWKVSFIPREGNRVADLLANMGRGLSEVVLFTKETARRK